MSFDNRKKGRAVAASVAPDAKTGQHGRWDMNHTDSSPADALEYQLSVTGTMGLLNVDEVMFVPEVTEGTRTVALRDQCGAALWITP